MRFTVLVAACALAAAGCGDDPVSPGADSTLSFTYTGARASSATAFDAAGQIPFNIGASFGSSSWAAGASDPASNFSTIGGSIPRSSTTYDFIAIGVTLKTPGTSPIEESCDDPEAESCTGVFVFYDFQPDGDDMSFGCFLSTGSVTLTTVTAAKIAGTFSGSGTCLDENFLESPFSITDGAFNVDVTSQIFGGASAARSARMSLLRRPAR